MHRVTKLLYEFLQTKTQKPADQILSSINDSAGNQRGKRVNAIHQLTYVIALLFLV